MTDFKKYLEIKPYIEKYKPDEIFSMRITLKDRLCVSLFENNKERKIVIFSSKGHYRDK